MRWLAAYTRAQTRTRALFNSNKLVVVPHRSSDGKNMTCLPTENMAGWSDTKHSRQFTHCLYIARFDIFSIISLASDWCASALMWHCDTIPAKALTNYNEVCVTLLLDSIGKWRMFLYTSGVHMMQSYSKDILCHQSNVLLSWTIGVAERCRWRWTVILAACIGNLYFGSFFFLHRSSGLASPLYYKLENIHIVICFDMGAIFHS